ncbi:uncharacterized protein LOC111621014 [Centruroides sculpturatus]|uniref:uncharacterized protein LOC111621014 n=1 Tax=Centruroides sculpturatus TaxID=218467 RepID=UPI000C6E5A57|nr:uncharacterized protein LOC111621014 [Centruroides sculpturatus]
MESECTLSQNEETVCNNNVEDNLNILEDDSAHNNAEVIINYKQNIEDTTAEFGANNFQFTNNGLKNISIDENSKAPQIMVYNLNDKETNSSLTVENFEPLLQDSEALPVTELQNNEILETLSDNENYISPNCSPSAPLYFIASPESKVNGDISKSLNMPDSQNNVSEEPLTRNEFLSSVQNDILHLLDPNEVNSVPLTNKVQPPVTTQFYLYPADPQFSLCNNRMINCTNNSPNFRYNSQVPIESPQQFVFTQLPHATFHGPQVITTHSLISRNENLPLMTSQGQFISSQPNAQITSMFPFPISSYNQNNDQVLRHKSPQFYADTFVNNRTTINKNTSYSVPNLCPQNKPALSNRYFVHDNKSGSPQQGSIFNEVHYMNSDNRPYENISTPLRKQHVNILSDPHKEYNVYPIESVKHATLSSATDPKCQENPKDSVQTTNNTTSNSNICLVNSEQFQQISPSLNDFPFQKSSEVINSMLTSFQPSSSLEPKVYPDKANVIIPLSIPNGQTELHYNLASVLGNHSQYVYYVPDILQSVQKNHSHPDSIYSSSETSPPIKEHTMTFLTPSLLNQSSRMDPNTVAPVSSSNNKQIGNQ